MWIDIPEDAKDTVFTMCMQDIGQQPPKIAHHAAFQICLVSRDFNRLFAHPHNFWYHMCIRWYPFMLDYGEVYRRIGWRRGFAYQRRADSSDPSILPAICPHSEGGDVFLVVALRVQEDIVIYGSVRLGDNTHVNEKVISILLKVNNAFLVERGVAHLFARLHTTAVVDVYAVSWAFGSVVRLGLQRTLLRPPKLGQPMIVSIFDTKSYFCAPRCRFLNHLLHPLPPPIPSSIPLLYMHIGTVETRTKAQQYASAYLRYATMDGDLPAELLHSHLLDLVEEALTLHSNE